MDSSPFFDTSVISLVLNEQKKIYRDLNLQSQE
jgi:hypothetical protein